MTFVNTYRPPVAAALADPYGPDPWDVNFMFPVPPVLENDLVRLVPFIPRLHADGFWDVAGGSDPELYRFYKHPFASKAQFLDALRVGQASPAYCTFLVLDRTRPEIAAEGQALGGAMAGVMSFMSASVANRSIEVGWVVTLASAQRTHVTTNAAGLLLQYALNAPSDSVFPGLGLRRVQWTCDAGNAPSLRTAKRLGFRLEGTLRWAVVLPATSAAGDAPRADDPVRGRGRHECYLSVCWDDWEAGGRALLEAQMARQA